MVENAQCRSWEVQDNNKITWKVGSPRPVPSPAEEEMPALGRSFACSGRKMGTESKKEAIPVLKVIWREGSSFPCDIPDQSEIFLA